VRSLLIPLTLLLLLLGSAVSAQQDYILGSVGLVPARFYVGDHVQVYARVSLENSADLQPPGALPPAPDLELMEVSCNRIREGEWEVQIHFISFRPGKFTIPALDLGGIRLRGIELETRSVLEDKGEGELRPPRQQLVIPGTWFKIGLLAAFLVLLPPFLIFLWRKVPGWLESYREVRSKKLPAKKIRTVLRRLARDLREMDGRRFFTELTLAIRVYLTNRLAFPADKATTREIGRIMPMRLPPDALPQQAASGMAALLERGDHVKFGGKPCRSREMEKALVKTEELVQAIEEAENHVES
jgi:hypothetical protein